MRDGVFYISVIGRQAVTENKRSEFEGREACSRSKTFNACEKRAPARDREEAKRIRGSRGL